MKSRLVLAFATMTLVGVLVTVFRAHAPNDQRPQRNAESSVGEALEENGDEDTAFAHSQNKLNEAAVEYSRTVTAPIDGQANDDRATLREEDYLLGDTMDTGRLIQLRSEEVYAELFAQLGSRRDAASLENRSKYELLFYSQPLTQDGTVVLDSIACGARLCLAEFRGDDQDVLKRFVRDATRLSEFEGSSIMHIPLDRSDYGGGQVRRIVFSHDSAIRSATIDPEAIIGGTATSQ